MPKILSYTPPWLCRPEAGFHLFGSSQGTLSSPQGRRGSGNMLNGNANGNRKPYLGPKKTLARRGTEIFVVVNNKIRWSDLCMLRDIYDDAKCDGERRRSGDNDVATSEDEADQSDGSYRILRVPVAEKIRQLSISPNGNLLAIVTSHTVHVAVLPDSSKLGQTDKEPLKLKTNMVAPTTHVLAHSPVASVLWHPCGVDGTCLVTITADAVVRLWEFNFRDHMSFDTPALAIDLKKLAVGTSLDEDFRPNNTNANRSFSLDSVGMDVASACFGGNNTSEESSWCAMTLWVAMKEGDVYALCPLLPSKWQPSSTVLPSLSAQAIANQASMQDGLLDREEWQRYNDQYRWIAELDGQEPYSAQGENQLLPGAEVYRRPSNPGAIPRLQGPFQISGAEYDRDLDLSDVHVIAAKVDADELMNGEDTDTDSGLGLDDDNGLSASIVCLLTRTGRVHICLDIDGVQAQWLPKKQDRSLPNPEEPSLVPFEILDTMTVDHVQETEWPTFSLDVNSRYSFFVTHSQGIYYFSLEDWIQTLESELQSTASVGTAFRMEIISNGPGTLREQILDFQNEHNAYHSPTAAVILQDSDLGYFLLTEINGVPQAVLLDKPDVVVEEDLMIETTYYVPREVSVPVLGPPRQPYVPPSSLWEKSALPQFVNNHVQSRHKKALKEEIRLSSMTLDLMTEAHRVLSEETHTLGKAAADLFRRCERLQDELREQIGRVKETASRTDEIVGDLDEADDNERPNAAVERRLEDAQIRQEKINARFEVLAKKVRKYNGKPLSAQEQAYMAEVRKISSSVIGTDGMANGKKENEQNKEEREEGEDGEEEDDDDEEEEEPEQRHLELWYRYDEAKRLAADMVAQTKNVSEKTHEQEDRSFEVPPDFRKSKVEQVMNLLERESALVDAAQSRLERLSLATIS